MESSPRGTMKPLSEMTPAELVDLRQQIASEFERRYVCDHGFRLDDVCPHCLAEVYPATAIVSQGTGLGGLATEEGEEDEDLACILTLCEAAQSARADMKPGERLDALNAACDAVIKRFGQ
jgi:hypothetical protein